MRTFAIIAKDGLMTAGIFEIENDALTVDEIRAAATSYGWTLDTETYAEGVKPGEADTVIKDMIGLRTYFSETSDPSE